MFEYFLAQGLRISMQRVCAVTIVYFTFRWALLGCLCVSLPVGAAHTYFWVAKGAGDIITICCKAGPFTIFAAITAIIQNNVWICELPGALPFP